jgi:hypothetical protein
VLYVSSIVLIIIPDYMSSKKGKPIWTSTTASESVIAPLMVLIINSGKGSIKFKKRKKEKDKVYITYIA